MDWLTIIISILSVMMLGFELRLGRIYNPFMRPYGVRFELTLLLLAAGAFS